MAVLLCRLEDISESAGRGFRVGGRSIFVVRKNGRLFGYVNACPHVGTPLDWAPDVFLDLDRQAIQCSTHGARFRIEDGYCFAGPCAGRSLTPVALAIAGGMVALDDDEAAPDPT